MPVFWNKKNGSHRWRGSALILVLIVSLVVSIFLSHIITKHHFSTDFIDRQLDQTAAIYNFETVLRAWLKDTIMEESCLNIFALNGDTVCLKTSSWGLFDLVDLSVESDGFSIGRIGLTGQSNCFDFTLRLINQGDIEYGGTTRIDGEIQINGNLTQTNKRELRGDRQVFSTNGYSFKTDDFNSRYKKYFNFRNDTSLILKHGMIFLKNLESVKIHNDFDQPTLVYFTNEDLNLHHLEIKGNVMLISKRKIIVSKSSELQDIIIVGNILEVEKGFEGNFQAFFSEEIKIGNKVNLNYPSVLFVDQNTDQIGGIIIEQYARVKGEVHLLLNTFNTHSHSKIELKNGSIIYGLLHTNADLVCNGSVYGSTVCGKISSRFRNQLYQNAIFNAVLSRSILPAAYSNTLIFSKKNKERKIVKWLN